MGTTTTNLELYKPDVGEDGWGLLVNANWDVIDALELTGGGLTDVTVLGTPNVAVTSHVTSDAQILGSGARSTTQTVDFTNEYWVGMILVVAVSSAGTATVTPRINAIEPVGSTAVPLWTGAAISTAVTNAYVFRPGVATTALTSNVELINSALPRTVRITLTYGGSGNITYSVSALRVI